MLWRWLCSKGYEVLVEQQIAHELQLSNVKTGTLAEIGQQADLAVVVGGDGNMLGAARTLARYDINVIGINRGNLDVYKRQTTSRQPPADHHDGLAAGGYRDHP